ncbi:MAG: PAQR family membrane homeostasis protein TrhA, partial [Anaerolineales bacterium]
PVNGLMHLGAAVAAAAGLVVLLYLARASVPRLVSLTVYGATLVLMFSASAAYHLVSAGPRATLFLRKLDHSAIYLLIAGTYTPICLHFFSGFWRVGLPAVVWGLALLGIGVKLFIIRAPRWVTAAVYLAMGWLSLSAIGEILSSLPAGALAWLVLGGLFFTGGAVIYVLKKPDLFPGVFGFHEIWHVFVILGALSHFVLMAGYVAPALSA